MAEPMAIAHGIPMSGRIRQRAVAVGLSEFSRPKRAVSAASVRHPSSGRAHPQGTAHPRGSAPRQRRRGASAPRQRRAASGVRNEQQRTSWNEDTRTVGVFDTSLVRQSRLADAMSMALSASQGRPHGRSSGLAPEIGSASEGVVSGLAANVSGRSTPRRSPHRPWAALRQRLEVSAHVDMSGLAQSGKGRTSPNRSAAHLSESGRGRTSPSRSAAHLSESGRGRTSPSRSAAHLSDYGDFDGLGSPLALSDGMPMQVPCGVPAAPGPVQLEVVHIQRAPEVPFIGDLAIVLPDGTSLGAGAPIRASAGTETVVVMPGGATLATQRKHDAPASHLSLEAPFVMEDKVKTVSERLSLLLRPQDSQLKRPPSPITRDPPARGSKLLSQNQSTVLTKADVLVDAVLQHILGDTVDALNQLPGQARRSPEEEVESRTGPAKGSMEVDRAHAHTASHAYVAVEQLHDLESTLVQKYGGQRLHTSVATSMAHNQLHSSVPTHVASNPHLSKIALHELEHTKAIVFCRDMLPRACMQNAGQDRAATKVASADERAEDLQPAALPLECVREIEKYRTRFAHHCLASREAGIDRSDPGDATCVATWTIWPHLADTIVLAAVESAIEDVHEALERHVEELVREEVAGIHSEG